MLYKSNESMAHNYVNFRTVTIKLQFGNNAEWNKHKTWIGYNKEKKKVLLLHGDNGKQKLGNG